MEQEQALELLIKSQAEQILRLEETNARHLEQLAGMQEKIDKLLSQVAWFTRQFFGRKSEKLAPLDPNQLSLFETAEDALQREEEIGQARLGAVSQISEPAVKGKKERSTQISRSRRKSNTLCSARHSSTTPRFEAKWALRVLTRSI